MSRKSKPPIALYAALADATRCRIIEILADGPIPVHRLADAFSISRPAISRHLRVLKQAGLVAEVRKGRENLYTFRARKLDKAISWLNAFSAHEPAPTEAEESIAAPSPVPPAAIAPPAADKPRPRPKKPPQPQPAVESVSQMGFDF